MSRRPRGDGALFYDSTSERWVGRVVVNGTRRKVTAKTKSEARQKLADMRADADAGKPIVPGNATVQDLLDQWFEKGLPGRNIQPSSVATHEWARKIINDEIGTKRLKSLSPDTIEDMYRRRADAGLSKASLAKLRTTLRMALQWAQRRELVSRNVASVTELPHDARMPTPRKWMTVAQVGAFLAASEGTPLDAMWRVMVYLGLRPGEAAGLSWDDVDFDSSIVHVRQSLKRGASGELLIGTPKTMQSVRSLEAPACVMDALRIRRRYQREERLLVGDVWDNEFDLVFTTSIGTPCDPAKTRSAFNGVIRAAGLGDGWSPNTLRHTAASLLSDAGFALEEVADQLGHKDTRMASLHYRHRVRPTVSGGKVMGEVLGRSS